MSPSPTPRHPSSAPSAPFVLLLDDKPDVAHSLRMSLDARSSGPEAGSATSLRLANQRRVLSALLANGAETLTQSDLTRETGLASGTVSSIVRELAAEDIVTTVPGSGRRGTTVRLARGAGLAAGIDFGHGHLAVALGDMSGEVIGEAGEPIDADLDHEAGLSWPASCSTDCWRTRRRSFRRAHHRHGPARPDHRRRRPVLRDPARAGWASTRAKRRRGAFGRPVHVENDANLGALAEHRRGLGRGHDNVVFVKVSSGVGAGLIIHGELFRGTDGTAGRDRPPHPRRPGAPVPVREPRLSGDVRRDRSRPDDDGRAAARRHDRRHHRGREGGQRLRAAVFEDAGMHLAWGLAAVTNLINPGVILVGGDMSHAGDLILDSARLGMRRHVLSGSAAATPVWWHRSATAPRRSAPCSWRSRRPTCSRTRTDRRGTNPR